MSATSLRRDAPAASGEHPYLVLLLACLLLALVTDQTQADGLSRQLPLLAVGMVGLSGLLAYLLCRWLTVPTADRADDMVHLLLVAGFLLRLYYILYTPTYVRQHDVYWFSESAPVTELIYQRHADYIEYIARYLRFPVVDPTADYVSQLYHPPLHHLLAGLWLRLNVVLGTGYARATESIQLLTLFYSSCCMVLCDRLFRLLGLAGRGRCIATAIICFHPTFILLSGSVNNDLLAVTLGLAALVSTIRWYRAPSVRTILPVALAVGGSMMAKLSGGLLAPGIALVFLARAAAGLRADRRNAKHYLGQFAVFAVVCVPLGLWWPVRNALLFGTPLTYVPDLGPQSGQYLAGYTPFARLCTLSAPSLRQVFQLWASNGAPYNEYSIPLSLLKTSLFGEWTLFDPAANPTAFQRAGLAACVVLFCVNAVLVLLSLPAGVVCLVTRRRPGDRVLTAMLLVVWGVLLFSFVRFCFLYPQCCTQNFRYLVPTLAVGAAFVGRLYGPPDGAGETPGWGLRALRGVTAGVTGLFCLTSAVVYTLLGQV